MWVALTLLCAFSLATSDALTKRALREADERLAAWLRLLVCAPPLLALLLFIDRPPIGHGFWVALGAGMPLEVLSFYLYVKALRVSPMSLSLPFLAFTPIFLIGVGWLLLGESPTLPGAVGILIISAGGYVLNLEHLRRGLLEPVRAIFRERGAVLMLAVAFIYAFTASLIKMGINSSSALFYGVVYFTVLPLAYAPLAVPRLGRISSISRRHMAYLVAAGLLMALMVVTHVVAVSLTEVAYMVAVKRTSLLISVLYGCLVFREGRLGERAAGALMMVAGFAVIVALG
jgi:drug/metabolite transporter (DMT)-like permease